MRSVAATHDTVLKPTVTEYTTYAEIPNVVGLRASVKFGAFFKTAPALATRCAAMPGLSEACAPRPTRAVALEPYAVFRDASLPAHDTVLSLNDSSFSAVENVLARFDADAGRFADASAEDSAETSGVGDAANRESLASRAALGLDPSHAVVVLGDLFCANGVAHVVDAPLAPDDFFKTAPTGQDPPSASPTHFFDAQSVPVFLQTPPPPAPAATSAPPPALMPVAAYFTAPPPPPAFTAGPPPSPPRTPGVRRRQRRRARRGTRGRARRARRTFAACATTPSPRLTACAAATRAASRAGIAVRTTRRCVFRRAESTKTCGARVGGSVSFNTYSS